MILGINIGLRLYFSTLAASIALAYYSRVTLISFSSSKLFKLQECIPPPMAPLSYPRVEKVVSSVTSPSLLETFPRSLLFMETHYI